MPFISPQNLKVFPFGDVPVQMCEDCGSLVLDETAHWWWHRRVEELEEDQP